MKDHTHISILLDRSGSMANCVQDTLGGINRFLEEQRAFGDNATVTVAQFGSKYELIYDNVPISKVEPITEKQYRIDGWTALLDSVGKLIQNTGAYLASLPEEDRPNKVFVVITTDGHENYSREFTAAKIKEMIKHQENKYNWSFVFLGAEIGIEQGLEMGLSAANSASYSKGNSIDTYGYLSRSVVQSRGIAAAASLGNEWKEKVEENEQT